MYIKNSYKKNQNFTTLRWVISKKVVDGQAKRKSSLVTKGFQEGDDSILSDSPTCKKINHTFDFNYDLFCLAMPVKRHQICFITK